MNRLVNVAGIATSTASRKELVDCISERIKYYNDSEKPYLIFSSNGQAIALYHTDDDTRESYLLADLVHADGQSVVFFSKILYGKSGISERSATTDLISDIPILYKGNLRHFFLGGEPGLASDAAQKQHERFDNFIIAGSHHGFFDEKDIDGIIDTINKSKTDILWIGLGKPKEQLFCTRFKDKINVPVIISCGGCFNFITGQYLRAPEWMQKIGLEWFHRLIHQPKKLMFRYLTTNFISIYYFITKWRSNDV